MKIVSTKRPPLDLENPDDKKIYIKLKKKKELLKRIKRQAYLDMINKLPNEFRFKDDYYAS